jgi:glutamate N-acetyltransferase/amino-acid N-acetyltransferase
MTEKGVTTIPGGGVTSAKGFFAGATCAGLKTRGNDKLDLGIVYSETSCVGAGVFTTNAVVSPGVTLTRERVSSGHIRGVVANSGCANACVGPQGLTDAREMAALAAARLGVGEDEVLVASTGIIGVELPMSLIRGAVDSIEVSPDGGPLFARAIMTTDSHPKEAAVSFEIDGTTCTIGAVAKGVGMIHPNMATLLCFIATDAAVEPGFLREALVGTMNVSLNMVTIDGDSSTNDSAVVLANGAAGNAPIRAETSEAELFQRALTAVCTPLTKMVAKDGEGATKLIEVTVEEAATVEDARRAAKTVASSLLVKAAVHGGDPNWGRVAMALGRSGARVQEETLSLYMNEICVFDVGAPIPFFKEAIVASMQKSEIKIRASLGVGEHSATAWGCDLTEEYVRFNSEYTT